MSGTKWEFKFISRRKHHQKSFSSPKNKEHVISKGGVKYRYKCDHPKCTKEYNGETERTFGNRFEEDLRALSPIYDHSNTRDHSVKLDGFSVVDRESQGIKRNTKDAMFIWVNNPSLNRNLVLYYFLAILIQILIL